MRLTFLGTAAAEAYPNAFCDCTNCATSRERGGRHIRRRSAALIDDTLIIDHGPDIQWASAGLGIPLTNLHYALQTHEHSDHLDPLNFFARSERVGVPNGILMEWVATDGAVARTATIFGKATLGGRDFRDAEVQRLFNVRHRTIAPWDEMSVGPYRIIAIPAVHDLTITPLLYGIERDGRRLLYATDTTTMPDETWNCLAERGWRFDVVVMDHTFGTADRVTGHLNGAAFRGQLDTMRTRGLLADGARAYATHIAHHSNPPHDELVELCAGWGYDVAWDGLAVDV
ncbi:MAG TPA: MBL fold metallo-hydrolase [Thermomicrobiales bacterium]|jgi:phosphoribosyl 1,2-cyclic phosphate phosphodiesterase|nr:MBL fold metallo-hydrolase [Thermomicrobiales bacterium]